MVHLLTSLEIGAMDDRLAALRALRVEVLDTAEGPLPKNTARVLMQIMKEVVRARGNPQRQLELAHDFRITAAGKPRQVRKQLRNTHLFEMPEAWNQISFDDHVHDANTKGRKSATHLIMDAWIKGIRRCGGALQPHRAALGRRAGRSGAHHGDRHPHRHRVLRALSRQIRQPDLGAPGFPDTQAFLCFLEEPAVAALMSDGRRASEYQQAHVMALLESFNRHHIADLNQTYDIDMPPIAVQIFLAFVGVGQKSLLHLEKFIQEQLLAAMQQKAEELRGAYAAADAASKRASPPGSRK